MAALFCPQESRAACVWQAPSAEIGAILKHGDTVMTESTRSEPWLRATLTEVPAVHRAVLHTLQLAAEDLELWCSGLNAQELNARPSGIACVAFHVRHISRSINRLLTYAEGRQLSDAEAAALKAEMETKAVPEVVFAELHESLDDATRRIRALVGCDLEAVRSVGRQSLPTTLGGLLVHIAEHTQRHVGQAITTAKLVRSGRPD